MIYESNFITFNENKLFILRIIVVAIILLFFANVLFLDFYSGRPAYCREKQEIKTNFFTDSIHITRKKNNVTKYSYSWPRIACSNLFSDICANLFAIKKQKRNDFIAELQLQFSSCPFHDIFKHRYTADFLRKVGTSSLARDRSSQSLPANSFAIKPIIAKTRLTKVPR